MDPNLAEQTIAAMHGMSEALNQNTQEMRQLRASLSLSNGVTDKQVAAMRQHGAAMEQNTQTMRSLARR